MDSLMKIQRTSMGDDGGILITDTTAITGNFYAMEVVKDCVLGTFTTPNVTKNGTSTATTKDDWGPNLSAGTIILAKITAVTLVSGTVLLYK